MVETPSAEAGETQIAGTDAAAAKPTIPSEPVARPASAQRDPGADVAQAQAFLLEQLQRAAAEGLIAFQDDDVAKKAAEAASDAVAAPAPDARTEQPAAPSAPEAVDAPAQAAREADAAAPPAAPVVESDETSVAVLTAPQGADLAASPLQAKLARADAALSNPLAEDANVAAAETDEVDAAEAPACCRTISSTRPTGRARSALAQGWLRSVVGSTTTSIK